MVFWTTIVLLLLRKNDVNIYVLENRQNVNFILTP